MMLLLLLGDAVSIPLATRDTRCHAEQSIQPMHMQLIAAPFDTYMQSVKPVQKQLLAAPFDGFTRT